MGSKMRGRDPHNLSLLKVLAVIIALQTGRQAQHPNPQSSLPARPGNHTAVCAVITGTHLATGSTRLSFWTVFLAKVCKPGNGAMVYKGL